MIEQTSAVGGLTIVEFGANTASRGALWAGMIDLDEELREMGTIPLIVTPVGATAESLRLGARAANAFLDKLPTAHLAFIENERDGLIEKLHPTSDAAAAYRDEILPQKARATRLRMPRSRAHRGACSKLLASVRSMSSRWRSPTSWS